VEQLLAVGSGIVGWAVILDVDPVAALDAVTAVDSIAALAARSRIRARRNDGSVPT